MGAAEQSQCAGRAWNTPEGHCRSQAAVSFRERGMGDRTGERERGRHRAGQTGRDRMEPQSCPEAGAARELPARRGRTALHAARAPEPCPLAPRASVALGVCYRRIRKELPPPAILPPLGLCWSLPRPASPTPSPAPPCPEAPHPTSPGVPHPDVPGLCAAAHTLPSFRTAARARTRSCGSQGPRTASPG